MAMLSCRPQIDDRRRLENRSQDQCGSTPCPGAPMKSAWLRCQGRHQAGSRSRSSIVANEWWWPGKLEPFVFRPPRSYRGLGQCSKVGNTHPILFSVWLYSYRSFGRRRGHRTLRRLNVRPLLRPLFLTWRVVISVRIERGVRLLRRGANFTNDKSHTPWCSGVCEVGDDVRSVRPMCRPAQAEVQIFSTGPESPSQRLNREQ